jgi:hypothetical protein
MHPLNLVEIIQKESFRNGQSILMISRVQVKEISLKLGQEGESHQNLYQGKAILKTG